MTPPGSAPARIVSLLPSTTEMVAALGLGDRLVGRSHECDHPPGVSALPVCTEPKIRIEGSSREIDTSVRGQVEQGLSVYRVDADRLRTLAPDVILTQDHCEVCAVSLSDVEAAVAEWTGGAPRVVSLDPRRLAGVLGDIETVAGALGVADRGREVVADLTARIEAVAEQTRRIRERPGVATIEWIAPLMAAGNWMPELIALAGGRSLFGEPGEHSPWLEWPALQAAEPDCLVVLPCGFDLERTRAEMPALARQPGFDALRAVREKRVFLVDGNAFFNRPGPRLAESLEILAEVLHPDHFPPLHEGSGWVRWEG